MWWHPGMVQYGLETAQYSWWMMLVDGLVQLLIPSGLIALAIWAVRTATPRSPAGQQPLEILHRRFATGEIDEAQYEHGRRVLRG